MNDIVYCSSNFVNDIVYCSSKFLNDIVYCSSNFVNDIMFIVAVFQFLNLFHWPPPPLNGHALYECTRTCLNSLTTLTGISCYRQCDGRKKERRREENCFRFHSPMLALDIVVKSNQSKPASFLPSLASIELHLHNTPTCNRSREGE